MILIDAIYINNGGGKVLLDYLIIELEKTEKEIFYLLDDRVQNNIPAIKKENKIRFMKGSLISRNNFYKQYKTQFSTVLCFGNLPPNIRILAKVYTYFHQPLYLDLPEDMVLKQKLIYTLKQKIVNHFKKNTNYWIVQSEMIKEKISNKYSISQDKILRLAFYPPFAKQVSLPKIPHTYLYVSNANPHKNHELLIEAFSEFYKQYKKGTLTLTISNDFPLLLQLVKEKQNEGVPIVNIGFVARDELQKLYAETEFLVFPSLTESFGLGLVEAIENGCKVIGADLPYTFAVCEPSLIFNPNDKSSIINALSLSLQNTKESVAKVKNTIHYLLKLLH